MQEMKHDSFVFSCYKHPNVSYEEQKWDYSFLYKTILFAKYLKNRIKKISIPNVTQELRIALIVLQKSVLKR